MTNEELIGEIDTPFGSFKDRLNAIQEGQAAYDHINQQTSEYEDTELETLSVGSESESEHITEIYQDAHDDNVSVYEWGEGEEAQQFILEESIGMEDQETAYRSRLIQEEGATYHLIQEKEGGETDVAMKTSGDTTFDVDTQEDFERVWTQLQGKDAELSEPNSLSQNSEYAAKSEYFEE